MCVKLDWDDFQRISGCQTGRCTEVKEDGKLFLGGTDLREQLEGEKLKSIDDFNKAQSAGGAEAAPVLERLRNAMYEMGIDKELFDQVVDGMKKEFSGSAANESELLAAVSQELGEWKRRRRRRLLLEFIERNRIDLFGCRNCHWELEICLTVLPRQQDLSHCSA